MRDRVESTPIEYRQLFLHFLIFTMAYLYPELDRLLELALERYNAANPTATLTRNQASRALVIGIESLISTNAANAGTVTNFI